MSVWVQHVNDGERNGEPFEITPIPRNVNDLKKSVKEELNLHATVNNIYVFEPGADVSTGEFLRANQTFGSIANVSYDNPIILATRTAQQEGKFGIVVSLYCFVDVTCCISHPLTLTCLSWFVFVFQHSSNRKSQQQRAE